MVLHEHAYAIFAPIVQLVVSFSPSGLVLEGSELRQFNSTSSKYKKVPDILVSSLWPSILCTAASHAQRTQPHGVHADAEHIAVGRGHVPHHVAPKASGRACESPRR